MTRAKVGFALGALAVLGLVAGCDWESGSSSDSTSSRYNWVSFSGVYRASGGGVLISDYTSSATSGTTSNTATQTLGTKVFGQAVYSGRLSRTPVIAGSLRITAGSVVLVDDGSGALASAGGATGTIIYSTGAWSIDLTADDPASVPAAITAIYQYESAGTPPAAGASSGVSGRTIYAFTVVHQGNDITITDNNGATYSGKFGSIRDTGGVSRDTPSSSGNPSGTLIGDFRVTGVSASGVKVTMVGTFQATATSSGGTGTDGTTTTTSVTLTDRQILGTWIEEGGRTGNISGTAADTTATTGPVVVF